MDQPVGRALSQDQGLWAAPFFRRGEQHLSHLSLAESSGALPEPGAVPMSILLDIRSFPGL